MPVMIISETFDFKPSSRQYLDNGFLRVKGQAARTGVYQYLASELGLTDRAPSDIVNVYRPENEVFDEQSIASYANVDVTNNHPDKLVNSESFKQTSVGHVVSAERNGDFVDVDMIIKDESTIRDVERGKTQLSPGYTAVYVEEKGVSPCGQTYDFKQTSIHVNHVAVVDRARGGPQIRINDHKPGVHNMPVMITLDSGRTVDAADPSNATLVADTIDKLRSALDSNNELLQTTVDEMNKEKARADEAEEMLEKEKEKTTDSAISERIKAVSGVMDSARKLAGDKFTCDSCDPVTIMRAALTVAKDGIDWNDKADMYVQARFDAAVEAMDAAPAANADQLARLAADAATVVTQQQEAPKLSAYDSFKQSLGTAHKPKEA